MNKNQYLIHLSESNRTDFGRVDFSQQSEPQKVFSAIWALESEVNNGGFLQYFSSWQFDTANYVPTALRKVGAHACADLVERALLALSPSPLPDSQWKCQQLVDSLNDKEREKFEELDNEFIAYPDDLTELLHAFVKSLPQVFGQ